MCILIWISISDIESFTIPDTASGVLVVSGLIVTWLLRIDDLWTHLLAIPVWFGIFWAVATIFKAVRGFDGLGLGDAKLMGGAGAWLGLTMPISVVLFASISGICFLLVMKLIQSGDALELKQSAIAFGPFLCLSIWSVWLFGPLV